VSGDLDEIMVLEGRRVLQSGMASKFGHWLPSPENLQQQQVIV
jgi:hypothetical protein